jgi:hypothetical protein
MSLTISKNDHPAESTHWYTRDGLPAYEVMAKNGNMRPTTLADARKMNLLPSVSTIIKCAATPGLEQWKMEQMLLAALTLPRLSEESEVDFLKRVRTDSRETGKKAAERGTAIHTAVEGFYRGDGIKQYPEMIRAVENALTDKFGQQDWLAEKSFACKTFGGKVDLCSGAAVLDFKTKEFTSDKLPTGFEENTMQLAAYRQGLGLHSARCANVFISVNEPGLVHIVEWDEDDLNRGWKMFSGLLDYWYAKTQLNLDIVRESE